MDVDTILQGDALELARKLPDNSIHCIITSPPYWGLRDYGTPGQLGLEPTPGEHIAKLVELFQELRRALRPDGTLWLNYGDCYASQGEPEPAQTKWQIDGASNTQNGKSSRNPGNLKPKDLVGMAWRIAFALQDDGWWLRNDIVWHKKNPMPESVTDRFTRAHEFVFLLAKSERYFFDQEAVREPGTTPAGESWQDRKANGAISGWREVGKFDNEQRKTFTNLGDGTGRNRRDVWSIASEPFPDAHFATFPRALVRPCILAGCPPKVCPDCGAPWVRVVEKIGKSLSVEQRHGRTGHNGQPPQISGMYWTGPTTQATEQWQPTCVCDNPDTISGIVLDPFIGSGTVAQVAIEQNRRWLGFELNPEYIELAWKRIQYVQPVLL